METPRNHKNSLTEPHEDHAVLKAFDEVAERVDAMVEEDTLNMSPVTRAIALAEVRLRLFNAYFPEDASNSAK